MLHVQEVERPNSAYLLFYDRVVPGHQGGPAGAEQAATTAEEVAYAMISSQVVRPSLPPCIIPFAKKLAWAVHMLSHLFMLRCTLHRMSEVG